MINTNISQNLKTILVIGLIGLVGGILIIIQGQKIQDKYQSAKMPSNQNQNLTMTVKNLSGDTSNLENI